MHITYSTPIVRARVKNLKTVTKDSQEITDISSTIMLMDWMDGWMGLVISGWDEVWSNIKEASINATNKHDFPVIPVIIIFKSVKLDELVWV